MSKARDWGDVGAEGGPGAIRRAGDDPAMDIPFDDAPAAKSNGDAARIDETNGGPPLKFRHIINPADWEGLPVPPREWIVPDYIPHKTVTLLSGDGSIGKSLLALQLAVARAIAREWIGLLPEPGRTLILSAEDDADEMHRRLEDIRNSAA